MQLDAVEFRMLLMAVVVLLRIVRRYLFPELNRRGQMIFHIFTADFA
jgi:hypothetical protein